MPLSAEDAIARVKELLEVRDTEASRLDLIHDYVRDEYRPDGGTAFDRLLWWMPRDAPAEVRRIAKASRVNVLRFVPRIATQGLIVTGYRSDRTMDGNEPAWDIWQENRLDKRQSGVHRAALTYGASYTTILPASILSDGSDLTARIRGRSPRDLTAVYGMDDDWPVFALERLGARRGELWRLFDDEAVYMVGSEREGELELLSTQEHGRGHVPVVRFLPEDDLDDEVVGEVEPLLALQDQINITTFGLMVAQHYGAFRQRYILGWLAKTEEQLMNATAAKVWTFEDGKDQGMEVGEFGQTDLSGYITSRQESVRLLATVSQTPVHELLGQLANLSADALVAARHSADEKSAEQETSLGESWEQTMEEAGDTAGLGVDPAAQVQWKQTQSRSLAQVADALGKIATQLQVPPQALWEMIPGVDATMVQRWRNMSDEADAFAGLRDVLDRASAGLRAEPSQNGAQPAPVG